MFEQYIQRAARCAESSLEAHRFRIDAAKHQSAEEMQPYVSQLPDDAFVFGEVIEGFGEAVKPGM